jgi:secreted trypsin-like serine protease
MLGDKTLVGIVSWGKGCGQPDYPGKLQHFVINVLNDLVDFSLSFNKVFTPKFRLISDGLI